MSEPIRFADFQQSTLSVYKFLLATVICTYNNGAVIPYSDGKDKRCSIELLTRYQRILFFFISGSDDLLCHQALRYDNFFVVVSFRFSLCLYFFYSVINSYTRLFHFLRHDERRNVLTKMHSKI